MTDLDKPMFEAPKMEKISTPPYGVLAWTLLGAAAVVLSAAYAIVSVIH